MQINLPCMSTINVWTWRNASKSRKKYFWNAWFRPTGPSWQQRFLPIDKSYDKRRRDLQLLKSLWIIFFTFWIRKNLIKWSYKIVDLEWKTFHSFKLSYNKTAWYCYVFLKSKGRYRVFFETSTNKKWRHVRTKCLFIWLSCWLQKFWIFKQVI